MSAGRDNMMYLLDSNLEILSSYDLLKMNLDSSLLYVMSIDISPDNLKVLLGTVSSEIYEIAFSNENEFTY